jgi:hypothetical protein|uniref:Uncharacterized protein n=1 Tax=candidate division WOR-3 bacterium TaxID=2052148 RepID=A0A7C3UNK0_UNCW3
MICQLCGKRKGKRACPGTGNLICNECCGTKRIKVIECPETCPFLKKSKGYLKDRKLTQSEIRVRTAFPHFFQNLEKRIIELRKTRFRDLVDSDVKEALEQNLSNLDLQKKGIIYEYKSVNPKVQILSDVIGEFLTSCLEAKEKSYDLNTLIFLLKEEVLFLKRLLEERKGKTYYLDLISTLH